VFFSSIARIRVTQCHNDDDGNHDNDDEHDDITPEQQHRRSGRKPAPVSRLQESPASERKRVLARWKPVAYTPTTIVDKPDLMRELDATQAATSARRADSLAAAFASAACRSRVR
jgi:hypothetical protein